ncbi:MAG: ankyrin repeat domain-containing protein [Candidatus Babeliales bacterium]
MKKNYLLLMFTIFITEELNGAWWNKPYQSIGRLLHVTTIMQNWPIIMIIPYLLMGGAVFKWKQRFQKSKRFQPTIWEAIRNNDARIVSYHLRKNRNIIFELNDASNTPLHFAAACGNPRIINIILHYYPFYIDYQPVIDFRNVDKVKINTPLFLAVEYNKHDVIKLIIARGADINRAGDWVGSPLEKARQIDKGNENSTMEELLNQEVAKRIQREQRDRRDYLY